MYDCVQEMLRLLTRRVVDGDAIETGTPHI
jgi:hypothetical protein